MMKVTVSVRVVVSLLLTISTLGGGFAPSSTNGQSSPRSHLCAASTSVSQTAEKLLDLLLDHANSKGLSKKDDEIQTLMQEMINAKVEFDPRECLEGPLYAVAYQYGPTPFWIKYSKWNPSGKLNIEGQQFTSRQQENGKEQYDAIAYGEFFGKAVTVKVISVGSPVGKIKETVLPRAADTSSAGILVNSVSKLFGQSDTTASTKPLKKCPVDFAIQVINIRLCIFDRPIDLGIQGTGKLRVLFANPQMRIFYAPEDSTQGFEEAGLTVAQVRVDLLDPDFPRPLMP